MFDLESYLSRQLETIENALTRLVPVSESRPAVLRRAINHAVFPGGKRLRPILCLAAAEAAGGQAAEALPAAVAVELLHAYTLVHDDLPCMDDDATRRGRPSVHAAYGEAVAVLAGDALQAMAFAALAETTEKRPGMTAEMVAALALAAGADGVVGGQAEDIGAATTPDRETVEFVHRHKTADLFSVSLRLGALSVNANSGTVDGLAAFGHHLGMAFQLLDDLLDAPSSAPPDQSPELNCLLVMSRQETVTLAREHTSSAIGILDGIAGPTEPLLQLAQRLLRRQN